MYVYIITKCCDTDMYNCAAVLPEALRVHIIFSDQEYAACTFICFALVAAVLRDLAGYSSNVLCPQFRSGLYQITVLIYAAAGARSCFHQPHFSGKRLFHEWKGALQGRFEKGLSYPHSVRQPRRVIFFRLLHAPEKRTYFAEKCYFVLNVDRMDSTNAGSAFDVKEYSREPISGVSSVLSAAVTSSR